MKNVDSELVGRRVRVVKCTDHYTKLEPGTVGTIIVVDSLGTLHVRWDNGTVLGLLPDEDRWEMVN